MSGTDSTTIDLRDGKYVVMARGGYDGYIEREFDQAEDAMDFIAWLWDLNSSTSAFSSSDVETGTMRLINRRKFYKQRQRD